MRNGVVRMCGSGMVGAMGEVIVDVIVVVSVILLADAITTPSTFTVVSTDDTLILDVVVDEIVVDVGDDVVTLLDDVSVTGGGTYADEVDSVE